MNDRTDFIDTIDGARLFTRCWAPAPSQKPPRGVIQWIHGLGEHAQRYQPVASLWTQAGFYVVIADYRGHGQTACPHHTHGNTHTAPFGHVADKYGWKLMLSDTLLVNQYIRTHYPNHPIFLGGHSTGTLIAKKFLLEHPNHAQACILSSPTDQLPLLTYLLNQIIRLERLRLGRKNSSQLIHTLMQRWLLFGIKTPRTDVDWLSRNPQAIDTYLTDPLCGHLPSTQTWLDFLYGLLDFHRLGGIQKLPKTIPYYLLAGSKDPVSRHPKGIQSLARKMHHAGMHDITLRIYPEGRHEMLQEINAQEVLADLNLWLTTHSPSQKITPKIKGVA